MNSERQETQRIEERLRDYAGRRRQALGAPLEMPEPLRQRLLREVGGGQAGRRATGWFDWPRLLQLLGRPWVAATAAALLLGGLFVWTRIHHDRTEVASATAGADATEALATEARMPEAAPAKPAVAPSPKLSSPPPSAAYRVAPDVGSGGGTEAPAPVADTRPGLDRARVNTSAPPPKLVRAPEVARGNGGSPMTRSARTSADARANPSLAAPVVTTAPTSLSAAHVDRYVPTTPGPPKVRVRYAQRVPVAAMPVLNSFQIEQVGEHLQIVDEDQSVYAARVQFAPGFGLPMPAASTAVRAVTPSAIGRTAESLSQVVGITAEGTNRGLRQRVTLTGNLILTNSAGASPIVNQAAILTNQAALRFLLDNSRLEGLVAVGTTGRVTILAVPTER